MRHAQFLPNGTAGIDYENEFYGSGVDKLFIARRENCEFIIYIASIVWTQELYSEHCQMLSTSLKVLLEDLQCCSKNRTSILTLFSGIDEHRIYTFGVPIT